MRFFTLVLTIAGISSAVGFGKIFRRQLDLPTCALPCLTTTTSASFGDCSSTNETCLCTNPRFISNTTTCIEGACTGNDLQSAISAAESLCAQAGVSLDPSSILASVSATATAPIDSATTTTNSGSASPSASTTSASSSNGALSDNIVVSGLLSLGVGVAAWIAF